jgi:hypothetical protein
VWQEGDIESCWRPYSAGLLHSVCDLILNLQNCCPSQAKTYRRRGGLKQINSCREVLLQVTFKANEFYVRNSTTVTADKSVSEARCNLTVILQFFKVTFQSKVGLYTTSGSIQQALLPYTVTLLHRFPARESLVSDIPSGDGKTTNPLLQCMH